MQPYRLSNRRMVFSLIIFLMLFRSLPAITVDDGPSYTQACVDTSDPDVLGAWIFYSHYSLPGSAGALPIPEMEKHKPARLSMPPAPLHFHGEQPSQRFIRLLNSDKLPDKAFTVEMWINDHISQPIALLAMARDPLRLDIGWRLNYLSQGYADRAMAFELSLANGQESSAGYANHDKDGFKEYWRHIVAVYDGATAKLFVNGQEKAAVEAGDIAFTDKVFFEVAAYLMQEPYMETAHILNSVRLHDRALSPAQIQQRFVSLCRQVENGWLFPGHFHFNAGPYLSFVTRDSVAILWETDRPAAATIRWGESLPLKNTRHIDDFKTIQEIRIEELKTATPYFYQILAQNAEGQTLDSGILTFQTAVNDNQPFRFAVMGDTETRPHINQQLSRMIWDQRPNFLINLGDMTDGGKQHEKFQWNYEYFQGMTPLHSRIPVFPVPGNGEGDLYWYKRYHVLPGDESPYTFTYGNARFFMLDSNQRQKEFAPGGRQYEWLKEQLENCDADWTFVAFHHAPYTSEENDYGDSWKGKSSLGDPLVRPLVALLEAYHVDVVMFGHLHLYERTFPILKNKYNHHGILYLLSGGGGGNIEDFAPNPAYFTARTHRGHHFCIIEIINRKLTLQMFDINGNLKDYFTMEK